MADVAVCEVSHKKDFKKMNINPSILYLLPNIGTVGGTVAKVKSTLEHTKYKVYISTPYNQNNSQYIEEWEKHKNIKIIDLPERKNLFKSVLMLNKIIRKEEIRVVHSFFPIEMFIAFFLKLLNPQIKIVRSYEGNAKSSKAIIVASKIVLPFFDKVIFISTYVSDFHSLLTKRCKSKQIVDNAAYNICNFSIKEKTEVCNIVSVAGLNEMKNVFMYAEIGKQLKAQGFVFNMKVVGDGPLYNELKERIENYGIADVVKLEGKQIDPKPYYDEAYIYIHPADKEGFGMTIVEAMSAGLPVIVSNMGGVPELVENKKDGVIVDAYNPKEWVDAIIELYNNREKYTTIAKNGYETYRARFTPEIYANNLDKIYDTLIMQ